MIHHPCVDDVSATELPVSFDDVHCNTTMSATTTTQHSIDTRTQAKPLCPPQYTKI